MATRLAQPLEDVPTNTPGRRFQKAVWRALHLLRKTRKDLGEVGERLNATIADEMQLAHRQLAKHHEVQQLRFNDKGEARVVRVAVPVVQEVPAGVTRRDISDELAQVAATSSSAHRRTQRNESLVKATHQAREESGWEVEMPIRFRVEVRLGRIPGLPLVPLLRKLLMVPGVMRGAPPRAKQDKAKQKEQSRQAKAETAGSRVVDSAHNHQSSSGSARVSDAATAAAPAEVAPSPASGAENAASPLQVPPAQPRAGVKGGSACSAASSTSSSNSGRASSGRAASAAPAAPAPAPAAPAASREAKAAAAAAAAPEPEQKPRPATADAATSAVPEASSVSRASTRSARSVRSAGVGSAAVGSAPRPAASTQYSARHQQPQPSPAGSTGSSCGESSGSGGYVTIRPRSELADQEEGLLEDEEEEMEESEAGDLQPIPPTATRLQRLQTTAHTPASALFHRALHADEAESEAATGTRLQRLKATATTPAPILFPRPPPSESTSASATPESSLGLSSNFSDAPSKTLSVAIMETLETLDQKIMQMERRFEAWEDRFEQDGLLIAQQRNANMELASRVARLEASHREYVLERESRMAALDRESQIEERLALIEGLTVSPLRLRQRSVSAPRARPEPPAAFASTLAGLAEDASIAMDSPTSPVQKPTRHQASTPKLAFRDGSKAFGTPLNAGAQIKLAPCDSPGVMSPQSPNMSRPIPAFDKWETTVKKAPQTQTLDFPAANMQTSPGKVKKVVRAISEFVEMKKDSGARSSRDGRILTPIAANVTPTAGQQNSVFAQKLLRSSSQNVNPLRSSTNSLRNSRGGLMMSPDAMLQRTFSQSIE